MDRAGVAAFYGVEPNTIRVLVQRHREELGANGLRVLNGREEFEAHGVPLIGRGRPNATLFTRRSVLLVGMLLRDSITPNSHDMQVC